MIIFLIFLQVDSLSLEEVIDRAMQKSPNIFESKISLQKSHIQFYKSLSNLLPTITTTANFTKNENDETTTRTYSASTNLNIPILDANIIGSIISSGHQYNCSKIQCHSEISTLLLNLETAYYNLINSLELLKSAKLAIKHADENLKLVKAKYNLGAASRLELLQAEVFKLRARKEKAGAQILEISAQEALKSILASDCDLYPTDTLAMPLSLEFPPLDSLLVIMTNVNDNIQSAIELENIAKLNLIAAELSILPKISFFYGISLLTDSLIFDFQYYRENYKKNYGINISLPIFEIKTRIFDILNAKKESRLAGFTRKRILLETEKALKITYYSLQEAFENLKLAKREFDAASEASTIAKEQYTLGAISFLDFLAVEQDMFEAGVSYSSALSNFYIQRAQFSHLLGELI